METNNDIEPVVIFAGSIWEAELVKSLMENAEIDAFLLDENTGTLAPWYTAGGGAGSVKVVVSNRDLDDASSIVSEFEHNRQSAG
ncbi:MAG: DUF2007-related protein [Bacteroidota bacterium]